MLLLNMEVASHGLDFILSDSLLETSRPEMDLTSTQITAEFFCWCNAVIITLVLF